MRVPQLAAEITRNKKLDRVSHVHARPPSPPDHLATVLRFVANAERSRLKAFRLLFSPRRESKFSFNVSKKKRELELESVVGDRGAVFARDFKFLHYALFEFWKTGFVVSRQCVKYSIFDSYNWTFIKNIFSHFHKGNDGVVQLKD